MPTGIGTRTATAYNAVPWDAPHRQIRYETVFKSLSGVYNRVYGLMEPGTYSEREWILIGMAESCASRGYEATTVSDICALAGVSEASFEALFSGKEDCLVAALRSVLEEGHKRIADVHSPQRPWAAVVRDGVRALLELLAERPAFARLTLLDAPAAGGPASAQYAAAKAALLSYVERGRENAIEADIPAGAGRATLAGAEALVVGKILTGKGKLLAELAPEVAYLLTVPYLGQEEALRQAVDRSSPRSGLRAVA
jgi:AcrR family transcriptional regulator